MRKAIFLFFLVLGIGAGYLAASNDDWGLRVVMMAIGALFGGAVGGGLSRIGKRKTRLPFHDDEEVEPIPGMGLAGRDLAANYWRDEGHPQFMKPPRPESGSHVLDADKNI